jgi:hypothetical protein
MSGDLSTRASIGIVTAAAVIAAAFVILTWPDGDDDGDDDGGQAAQSAAVTPAAALPTPAPTPTPAALPGVDADFPKVAGAWTLESVRLEKDVDGSFGGIGVIAYTGKAMATASFVLVVYSGGRPVATLRAATSRANPKTSTTVRWVSGDRWVEDCDGYTFSAS